MHNYLKILFQINNVEYEKNISYLRWTIDRPNDLEFVRKILKKYVKKKPVLMVDILSILSNNPQLLEINKGHIVDEGYLKSLEEDKNL